MRRTRRNQRGATLIEMLVAIAIAALLAGGAALGFGAIGNARLRESATLIAAAVRTAYTHANTTSRTVRVVIDFGDPQPTITIEDSPGKMFLQSGDRTGGAAAADELEKAVIEESEEILSGERPPRPSFQPVKDMLGFRADKGAVATRPLGDKIFFRQVEVTHEELAVTSGKVYVYFFPGGQAERAAIQIQKTAEADVDEDDILTVLVHPLTGKVDIVSGPAEMRRPLTDEEASERMDTGF